MDSPKYILLKQSVGSTVPLTLELYISYPCIYVHGGSCSYAAVVDRYTGQCCFKDQ